MSTKSHKAHKVAECQIIKAHSKAFAVIRAEYNGSACYAALVEQANRDCTEALKAADAAYKATLKQS
jgi:hypothetical protein